MPTDSLASRTSALDVVGAAAAADPGVSPRELWCVLVQEGYRDCEDVLRIAQVRIRVPELGATGPEAPLRYERDWFDYSEQRPAAAIRRMPRGMVVREGRHDPIPGMPESVPVQVVVSVDPDEALIAVGLRDSVDCQPCGST